jgi:hypothetical protein
MQSMVASVMDLATLLTIQPGNRKRRRDGMKKCRFVSITGLLAIVLVFSVNAVHAAAGSLDPTFGNGGIVITPGGGGLVNDAVLQADAKIVVQGSFGVARFLSIGALDTSFGTSGFAQAPASADFGAVAL